MRIYVFQEVNTPDELREVLSFLERQPVNGMLTSVEPEPIIDDTPPAPVAEPRAGAEITVKPRTRKKTAKGDEPTQAALDALLPKPEPVQTETPVDPVSVFAPAPAAPVAPVPPTPPAPPAAPAPAAPAPVAPVPPAPGGITTVSDFMSASIAAIQAKRMTHEEVMALLKTHGVNNFAELSANVDKIPAIVAGLK